MPLALLFLIILQTYFRVPIIVGILTAMTNYSRMALPFMVALMGRSASLLIQQSILILCCRYSRKILWLEVSSTNKDSKVIASYYLQAVEDYGIYTAGCLYCFYCYSQVAQKLLELIRALKMPRYLSYSRSCDISVLMEQRILLMVLFDMGDQ